MKRYSPHALALALLVSILVSCGGPTTIPTGTYLSNSGRGSEQLKLSGTTYVIVVAGASYVQGDYTSTSRDLTLTTSGLSVRCRISVAPAQYRWDIQGSLLTLKMSRDTCKERADLLEQTWGKR